MPELARRDQRDCESLIRFSSRPQSLDLHVVPQHQILGIRMQLHLLVHPLRHRIAVQMMLDQRQRHDQQQ
jgi:hypothetical protein